MTFKECHFKIFIDTLSYNHSKLILENFSCAYISTERLSLQIELQGRKVKRASRIETLLCFASSLEKVKVFNLVRFLISTFL